MNQFLSGGRHRWNRGGMLHVVFQRGIAKIRHSKKRLARKTDIPEPQTRECCLLPWPLTWESSLF